MSSTPATSSLTEPPASSLLSLVNFFLAGLVYFLLLPCKLIKQAVVHFFMGNPNPNKMLSTLLFSSLPDDILLNCLARVPRRDYPTVSCVSKSFRSLMLSPELAQIRSLLGKDNPHIYVCFMDLRCLSRSFHWFTFNPKEKQTSEDHNNSIQVLTQHRLNCSTASIGSKIFFVGGSLDNKSSSLWIYDSWSEKLSRGPRMKVARSLPGVVGVNGKLYVMGGCRKRQIQVEVFDPKTGIWEVGPLCPNGEGLRKYIAVVTEAVALEGKIYGMSYRKRTRIIYDTKDGRCETFKMSNVGNWRRARVCVINNLIFAYYGKHGLMWYDSKDKVWRVVKGLRRLDIRIYMSVGMVDCNGKLGFVRQDWRDMIHEKPERRIWCKMIVLDKIGEEIHGTIESHDSMFVGSVPYYYDIYRCLSVSG